MNQLTVTQLSNQAVSPKDVNKSDATAFLNFYTNGKPDTVYVPVADFLAWKRIKVRSSENPHAMPARDWTYAYREVATEQYNEDNEMFVKKSVNGALLFDLDFLLVFYQPARDLMSLKAFGG